MSEKKSKKLGKLKREKVNKLSNIRKKDSSVERQPQTNRQIDRKRMTETNTHIDGYLTDVLPI